MNILKTTELYTFNGSFVCYVNYTIIKLFLKISLHCFFMNPPAKFLGLRTYQSLQNLLYVLGFLKIFLFICLFLERGDGREKEGEKHQCVVASRAPPTGDQVCALLGNQSSNPQVCRPVLNPLSHTSQSRIFIIDIEWLQCLPGTLIDTETSDFFPSKCFSWPRLPPCSHGDSPRLSSHHSMLSYQTTVPVDSWVSLQSNSFCVSLDKNNTYVGPMSCHFSSKTFIFFPVNQVLTPFLGFSDFSPALG